MKVNFNRPVEDLQGEPINFIIDQDDGERITKQLRLDNQIIDIINNIRFESLRDRAKANRITGLIADESVKDYEEENIEWLKETIDEQMPIDNKPGAVMSDIANVLYKENENG